jgi:hypothetical protein
MRRAMTVLLCAVGLLSPQWASAQSFRENNPDVDKFAFAKSFITSLGYYGKLDIRLRSETGAGDSYARDVKVVKALVEGRTLDNTELRVAKNYLVKYVDSRNMLIRKVAYDAMAAYEQHIIVSSRERRLWQMYQRFKEKGVPSDLNEDAFKQQMGVLAEDRKAAAMGMLRAVVMFRAVLLSAERCSDENCRDLALTESERGKLVKKLDAFAGDRTAWGMKPGQGTFEAAVAAVREVLEDPVFVSRP